MFESSLICPKNLCNFYTIFGCGFLLGVVFLRGFVVFVFLLFGFVLFVGCGLVVKLNWEFCVLGFLSLWSLVLHQVRVVPHIQVGNAQLGALLS